MKRISNYSLNKFKRNTVILGDNSAQDQIVSNNLHICMGGLVTKPTHGEQ